MTPPAAGGFGPILGVMASGVVRAVSMAAMILGLPALCGAGILYYGKMLAEAEVAEGTLRSPEESRRLYEELERRFRAMTPAEHVTAARRALDCSYDARRRLGGNFQEAERHLAAVPAGAEVEGVAAVRALAAQRRAEASVAVAAKVGELCATADALRGDESSLTGEPRRAAVRRRLARRLDHFGASVLGCVHTEGAGDTTLRFDGGACDAATIERHVPPANRPALRALGFARVRCHNGAAELAL